MNTTFYNRIKNTVIGFAVIISSLSFTKAWAQVGTWKAYMSYYEPQKIIKADNLLFVKASNSLYSYNLNDHSIQTFDKMRQLNDTHINLMAWNPKLKRLIVTYDNSNIDLIDKQGNVVNIGSLYMKSMTQDKTISDIFIQDQYAFLATGFGVVKVNMERAEITESYFNNHFALKVALNEDYIYMKTLDTFPFVDYNIPNNELAPGTVVDVAVVEWTGSGDNKKPSKKTVKIVGEYRASLSSNLMDPHNWVYNETVPAGIYDQSQNDWDEYIATVNTLKPGGPKYNNFGFMRFKNGKLYTSGGGNVVEYPGTIQVLNNDEWTIFQDNIKGNFPGTESSSWKFVNSFSVDEDPLDSKHVVVGGRTGLYDYYDGQLRHYWNKDNSILKTATTSNRYVIIYSVIFDEEGSLWLIQSEVAENSIIQITKDGEWISHPQEELMNKGLSLKALKSLYIDNNGYIWIANDHWEKSSFYCFDPKTKKIVNSFTNITNQDGISYIDYYPRCFAEDHEGNLWIGSQSGPFVLEKDKMYSNNAQVTQIKIPRNDGTNYADYLLSGSDISCMAIDAAGRKWIGTNYTGVYLISADNMEQIYNFTTSNSPLLSNSVSSIAINNDTGEVFFGTEEGLCSYMSDATTASIEMTKDNVYAYPNPVVSGYNGLITVKGLTFDADVKILTTSGQLVAQGRSNGGSFTWNGCDTQGHRVASGVYMVATATSEGKKGVVCKIAVIK